MKNYEFFVSFRAVYEYSFTRFICISRNLCLTLQPHQTQITMDNKQLVSIAQANVITESRYDFNRLEKNALYCIIRQVRKDYVETPREQPKAYANMHVAIADSVLSEIADDAHRKDAKAALVNLRHRDITIEDEIGNWLNVGFINWAKYDAKNKVFLVEVSSEIMPYLVDLARKYTVYSLTVAITLKSKWSQRFYELCCQYKNNLKNGTPSFRKNIAQLRKMFVLEDKYPKLPDFKKYVIDKAQNELKESYEAGVSELWFEYSQKGRGEDAEFKFIIHTRESTQAQQKEAKEKQEISFEIFKTLLSIFPKDLVYCEKCWHHLDMHPEHIMPLSAKLKRIMANYPKGTDRAKVTRYMLGEDFDMSKKALAGEKRKSSESAVKELMEQMQKQSNNVDPATRKALDDFDSRFSNLPY